MKLKDYSQIFTSLQKLDLVPKLPENLASEYTVRPVLSVNKLSITNISNTLLNCFVSGHIAFKTKQSRSLLLMLVIDNLFADKTGLTVYSDARFSGNSGTRSSFCKEVQGVPHLHENH